MSHSLSHQRRRSLPELVGRFGLMCALLLLMAQQHARADLMLNPTRVIFEKNQRAAQIDLINDGTEPATYRLSVVNRRMTETGEFAAADKPQPGEQFADAMIQFSPRQVTLAPGAAQIVRVMVRKPAELADGEYRSHLMFQRLPEASGENSVEKLPNLGSNEVGIRLTTLVGVSIPVIVRQGETSATVKFSDVKLEKPTAGQPPVLSLKLERSGNRSVYGDVVVSFAPDGGAEQVIGKAGGVAVYVPNPVRLAKLALQPPASMNLSHGKLTVRFNERAEQGGKTMAESTVALP